MQQIQSTISAKNQTVIPSPIRKVLQLKTGDKIVWRVITTNNQHVALAEPIPKSWTKYTRGLGKNIWQNIDIDSYIKNLRKEWDVKK